MTAEERTIQPIPKNEDEVSAVTIIFYCKNCGKIVAATQTKKKFHFRCPDCGKTEIAFGTEQSIRNHYRIKN